MPRWGAMAAGRQPTLLESGVRAWFSLLRSGEYRQLAAKAEREGNSKGARESSVSGTSQPERIERRCTNA